MNEPISADASIGAADVVAVVIDRALCDDCGRCLDSCPVQVFDRDASGRVVALKPGDCHVCFLCVPDCPPRAITVSWDAPNKRQQSIYDVLDIDVENLPA